MPEVNSIISKLGAVTTTTSTTNAGSDTPVQQSGPCTRWWIQNLSNANIYVEFDSVASTSSTAIPPNATLEEQNFLVSQFHFFTASATPINVANGIILKMWN